MERFNSTNVISLLQYLLYSHLKHLNLNILNPARIINPQKHKHKHIHIHTHTNNSHSQQNLSPSNHPSTLYTFHSINLNFILRLSLFPKLNIFCQTIPSETVNYLSISFSMRKKRNFFFVFSK